MNIGPKLLLPLSEDVTAGHKGILTKVQKNIPIRIQTAGQTQTPTGYEGNIARIVDWEGLCPISESLATREAIPPRFLLVFV